MDKLIDTRAVVGGDESKIAPIHLIQGHFSNNYFYVEKEISSESSFICELVLELEEKEHEWNTRTSQIF